MNIAARAIIFAFLIGLLCAQFRSAMSAPGHISVPPDSFINQHVASVSQLTQQVTVDPIVRRRLAQHFHVSGPAIVHYIQRNLVLKNTTASKHYLVYCVSPSGREYTVKSHLPAGTPIFVLKSTGQPILKLACGNPLVAFLPTGAQNKSRGLNQPILAALPHSSKVLERQTLAKNSPHPIALRVKSISPLHPTVKVASFPLQTLGSGGSGGGGGSLGYLALLPFLTPKFHNSGSGNSGVTPFDTNTGGSGTTGSTSTTGSTGTTGTTGSTGNTGTNANIGTNGSTTVSPGNTGTALVPESSGLVNMASVLIAVCVIGVIGKVRKRIWKKRMRNTRAL